MKVARPVRRGAFGKGIAANAANLAGSLLYTTSGNHSFIQRLLEQGIDERSLHTKRTPKSEIPTAECEMAVEAVLAIVSALETHDERAA